MHLWRLPGPTYLLKQDQLVQVAQGCVLSSFKYHKGWRLHNQSEQLVFQVAALQLCFLWFCDLPKDKSTIHIQELPDMH